MIFDKEKLLSVYDMTIAQEPMKSRSGLQKPIVGAPVAGH
jgi:hypothetical protein